MVLCVSAVGQDYCNFTLDFLNSTFSKIFKVYIQTDKPELFQSYNTNIYYKSTFNFFDKISYGVKVIDTCKEPGFIVDADDLPHFQYYYDYFDIFSKDVQYLKYWNEKGTLDSNLPEYEYFWEFMKNILKKEKIPEDKIYMVLEKIFFFPSLDYSLFLSYFESLRYSFEKNSRENGTAKNGVGNGEGVAFGYALFKSKLSHKKVV